jgi:hypothetical protein
MKICLILIALAVLCLNVQANPTKRSAYGSSAYGSSRVEPIVHMDTSYGSAPVASPAPVIRPVVPVQMDVPVNSYGSKVFQDTTVEIKTPVAIEELDPTLKNMCLERQNGIVFYLPHPTKQSFYIQCDQFGHAFLKECPAGTIFTQNLVCENINDLHPVNAPAVATRPVLDQTVGSYGSAPTFSADTPSVIETSHVEIFREAQEFNGLCTSHTLFYFQHPTDKNSFIQCDDFGKAFVRPCPAGLVFTGNLVCENPSDLHTVAPSLDRQVQVVRPAYGTVPFVSQDAVVTHTEIFQEAPEFKELCLNKNAYGAQVSTVFYIPHPTKQSFYIQCDQFGRAFLKECPVGTIFTLNLACENVNDLHAIEKETVPVRPQLDQTVGTYGSAPVFAAEASSITQSSVELVQEAPEFKELCLTRNAYGSAVSTVFYIPHPTNKNMYIQCNEFGTAYLKSCPIGTIFTTRFTCERPGEIETLPALPEIPRIVETPILREVQTNSYSQNIPVMTQVVERPVLREPITSYQQTAPVIQRPVLREEPITSYQQIQRPVLREEPITSYQQTAPVIQRPVLREQVVPSSYGQPSVPVQRPILRMPTTSY